jgi:ferredoxin
LDKPSEIELEQALAHRPDSITGRPEGPQRYDIEGHLLSRDGSVGSKRRLFWFLFSFPFMTLIRRDIRRSFLSVQENPADAKQEITPEFLTHFSELARAQGVGAIGYTPLPPEAIFQEKGVLFDQVIVLIMEMDAAKMAQAPSRETFRMVMETYYELGRIVNVLTDTLRDNGYAAQAGHPLNGVTLYPLVAQQAGLGWCGDNGLLITPEYGPRQRIGLIYTNIQNLPVAAENEHAWIADLCARCGQCMRFCPSQAIYTEPQKGKSGLVTHIDVDKCFPVFAEQYGCSICIKVCPFNLHPYAQIKKGFLHGARTRKTIS